MCSESYDAARTETGPLQARSQAPHGGRGGTLRRVPRAFSHRIRVRYGECDPQGIVFNANYFLYFDVALTELWREAIGPYQEMIDRYGVDLVVGEARCTYRAPARFDELIDLEMAVTRLGTTGMTSRIRILRDGALLVEGEMRHVFVEPDTHAKAPIPDAIRAALEPYHEPAADAAAPVP